MAAKKKIQNSFILFVILFCFFLGQVDHANAQVPSYPFNAVHNQIDIRENCALLEDTAEAEYSFSFVTEHKEAFLPLSSFGKLSHSSYWGKIKISPKKENNITMILEIGSADTIIVYTPTTRGKYRVQTTGIRVASSKNDELLPNTNLLRIDIPSKNEFHTFTIYFLVKSKLDLIIKPKLYDVGYVFKQKTVEESTIRFRMGIYLGILLFISILAFILFFSNSNHYFLYYGLFATLHAFFNVVVFKFGYGTYIGEFREYNFIFGELFGYSSWIFLMFFMRSFAETKDYFKLEHKLINWVIISSVILFIAWALPFAETHNTAAYILFRNIYLLTIFSVCTYIFVRFSTSKRTDTKIIGLGGVALTVCWLIYFSLIILGIGAFPLIYQAGQIIEIMFFIYALAYRMRQKDIDKQKSQSKLIRQLRKMRIMEKDAVEQLEAKVEERTEKIQNQNEKLRQRNEEILTQRDKIENQRDEIEAQRDELEDQTNWFLQQNAEISASIHYARRLQKALLHTQKEIDELLPNSFLFYIPRDIVSGDFYWVEKIYHYTIVAAADCTGHGVPGAFMSLIGVSALNEIVIQRQFTNPGLILDEMRDYVKRTLKQTGKQAEATDGIDVSLVVMDVKNKTLWYSGAFNPLVIIRNKEIIEIKADRMPVGVYYKKDQPFHTHEIELKSGDTLYMYSDGFADQIGGEKEKKFKTKNFKNLLTEISNYDIEEQKELLFKTYLNWKGSHDQIDDILVMGIKID